MSLHIRLSLYVVIFVALTLLAACATAQPAALNTLAPTVTPATPTPPSSPTPPPSPTPLPTATPIPPLELTIHWPESVSPLQPVPLEAVLLPPPGVETDATLRAFIFPPPDPRQLPSWPPTEGDQETVAEMRRTISPWVFDLVPGDAYRYTAREMLQIPLDAPPGEWRLVIEVKSVLPVRGERTLSFDPRPVVFRDLRGSLPAGVELRVPQDFVQMTAEGDQWAGVRVWRYGGGELALWWAPGPTEPLLLNNAIVMLEATHPADNPPRVVDSAETTWQGHKAFIFRESWSGAEGGQAEAWVVQGPDYRLYTLRIRSTAQGEIPAVFRLVRDTFTLPPPPKPARPRR